MRMDIDAVIIDKAVRFYKKSYNLSLALTAAGITDDDEIERIKKDPGFRAKIAEVQVNLRKNFIETYERNMNANDPEIRTNAATKLQELLSESEADDGGTDHSFAINLWDD